MLIDRKRAGLMNLVRRRHLMAPGDNLQGHVLGRLKAAVYHPPGVEWRSWDRWGNGSNGDGVKKNITFFSLALHPSSTLLNAACIMVASAQIVAEL